MNFVERIRFNQLVFMCVKAYEWKDAYARGAVREYFRFMRIKQEHQDTAGSLFAPSPVVDKVWILDMADSMQYAFHEPYYHRIGFSTHDIDELANKRAYQETLVELCAHDNVVNTYWPPAQPVVLVSIFTEHEAESMIFLEWVDHMNSLNLMDVLTDRGEIDVENHTYVIETDSEKTTTDQQARVIRLEPFGYITLSAFDKVDLTTSKRRKK